MPLRQVEANEENRRTDIRSPILVMRQDIERSKIKMLIEEVSHIRSITDFTEVSPIDAPRRSLAVGLNDFYSGLCKYFAFRRMKR